jgi:uncharacterized protein YqhQ
MTDPAGASRAKDRLADDGLPDSFEPGRSVRQPARDGAQPSPKGDVRIASWIALVTGVLVLVWYLSILVLGGVYLADLSTPAQVGAWVLAAVSLVCGLLSLNARRARGLASAGFIAGIVSLLVSLTIGLSTGFQILY